MASNGQGETEQPDHSASLGDSVTSSTRTGFSAHTAERLKAEDGDEAAVDAATLNVVAHRLENLIHDRRAILATRPPVSSVA
jgi:hypothetical protein